MVVYVTQNNGGNDNSPDSLNVMVNYHYHGENKVITQQFPSMKYTYPIITSYQVGKFVIMFVPYAYLTVSK